MVHNFIWQFSNKWDKYYIFMGCNRLTNRKPILHDHKQGMALPGRESFDFVPKIIIFPFAVSTDISGEGGNTSSGYYYTANIKVLPINCYFIPDVNYEEIYTTQGSWSTTAKVSHIYYNVFYYFISESTLKQGSLGGSPTWSNDGKTITWWANTASGQLNDLGGYYNHNSTNYATGMRRYYYMAIGT